MAQEDNLGDLEIRRILLEWIRGTGDIHVLTAGMPRPFLDAMDLDHPGIHAVADNRAFTRRLLRHAPGRTNTLLLAPGEYPLEENAQAHLRSGLSVVLSRLLRARGDGVAIIGRSFDGSSTLGARLQQAQIRAARGTWLRERTWTARLGGHWMPDIAFSRAPADTAPHPRDGCVVSLRHDSPLAPLALEMTRRLSRSSGTRPLALTQVRRDRATNQSLAEALEAPHLSWERETHHVQLARVTDAYRSARFVVSDRFHALAFGMVHGAVPVALCALGRPKLPGHFASHGVPEFCVGPWDDLDAFCRRLDATDPASLAARCRRWRTRLDTVREELLAL